MQHVLGTQQEFHRAVDRNACLGVLDQHVVLAVGVIGIHSERVVGADAFGIDLTEFAVLARVTIAPVPLLANGFNLVGVLGHIDEARPNEQAGRQHRGNTDCCHYSQPGFELFVLRLVGRPSIFLVAKLDDAVRHEKVDRHEHGTRHPERDIDREIDHRPVGSQRGESPGTDNVKNEGADNEQDQNYS